MELIKKKKSSIPVYIVEDHNDVLYHIYRAIGSKKIPFSDGLMVHFDSHPDLVVPKNLDPQKIRDRDYVLNSLSIENWIMPAVFAGHFNSIVWVKPLWATQLENGLKRFKIGIDRASQELKVTCPESYFVGEVSWCGEGDLDAARDVILQVCTLGGEPPKEGERTPADAESESPDIVLDPVILDKLDSCPFVLDIDLDFYSTRNPFLSLFTDLQFDLLRKLYHYQHPKELTEEALREATSKRQHQLSQLKSIFCSAKGDSTLQATPRSPLVSALLATFPDRTPPDAGLLVDAGCTCDDCDLPHHPSTRDQVRHLVGETESFLKKLPTPAVITVARSSRDDYCPPEDVDFIQERVLEMLQSIYGDGLEVSMHYQAEDDDEAGAVVATASNV